MKVFVNNMTLPILHFLYWFKVKMYSKGLQYLYTHLIPYYIRKGTSIGGAFHIIVIQHCNYYARSNLRDAKTTSTILLNSSHTKCLVACNIHKRDFTCMDLHIVVFKCRYYYGAFSRFSRTPK